MPQYLNPDPDLVGYMPQNKFHFRLHCVPSKIAIYLLHTSTVIQTTSSIQHLTKREVILALPGWPLIRSAWLAVTKLPVFLSSCLPVFRPCQHRPHYRTSRHQYLESSEQSKTCVKLIKRIPKFITRSPLLIGKIEVIEYYLLISS